MRANSHNFLGELDLAERQLEEDGELLVDFNSPAVTLPAQEVVGQGFGTGRRESEGTENADRKSVV